MRAPRAKASDRREIVVTEEPHLFASSEAHVPAGLIRKSRKWGYATTMLREEGSGIEKQVAGRIEDRLDVLRYRFGLSACDARLVSIGKRRPAATMWVRRGWGGRRDRG